MAVLSGQEIDATRQPFIRDLLNPGWKKSLLNAAIQAIEDAFSGTAIQNALSQAIDQAIAPETMTNAEKRQLVKWYLKSRFDRGN